MTGVYSQLYLDHFGNLPPIVRALAAAADDMEMKLERLRVHCGFHEDWSPVHDRHMRAAAATTDVSWQARCGSINGTGDLMAFIQEMCGWMDEMMEKVDEVQRNRRLVAVDEGLDYMVVSPDALAMIKEATDPPKKRGPGRPRKDAA